MLYARGASWIQGVGGTYPPTHDAVMRRKRHYAWTMRPTAHGAWRPTGSLQPPALGSAYMQVQGGCLRGAVPGPRALTGYAPTRDCAGTIYVKWPAICKHFGWDITKLCGPYVMAANLDTAANNCVSGHKHHGPRPTVNGKPFHLADHKAELVKLGLTEAREELKAMLKAGEKPPGAPKKMGKALIYPVPHFG